MNQFEKIVAALKDAVSVTPDELKQMKKNERRSWREYGRAQARIERKEARANR
jgi:hypothetical protein